VTLYDYAPGICNIHEEGNNVPAAIAADVHAGYQYLSNSSVNCYGAISDDEGASGFGPYQTVAAVYDQGTNLSYAFAIDEDVKQINYMAPPVAPSYSFEPWPIGLSEGTNFPMETLAGVEEL